MWIPTCYHSGNSRHAQTLVEPKVFGQEIISIVSPEISPPGQLKHEVRQLRHYPHIASVVLSCIELPPGRRKSSRSNVSIRAVSVRNREHRENDLNSFRRFHHCRTEPQLAVEASEAETTDLFPVVEDGNVLKERHDTG